MASLFPFLEKVASSLFLSGGIFHNAKQEFAIFSETMPVQSLVQILSSKYSHSGQVIFLHLYRVKNESFFYLIFYP